MGKENRPVVVYAADFETTTDNEEKVEVWSAESIEVNPLVPSESKYCHHQTNIKDFIKFLGDVGSFGCDIICYFHNLKFDGSYILNFLTTSKEFRLFSYESGDQERLLDRDKVANKFKMYSGNYTYMISDKNVIYSIIIKIGKATIEFRDSLKLLPFSLRKIAKDFGTEHKKLEMDYGNKQPGYEPNEEEMKYIENDVFVLKEALQILAKMSECKINELPMTIGAMAMNEYKQLHRAEFGKEGWQKMFPSQTGTIQGSIEGLTYDEYVRHSYKGGWCYVKPDIQGKVLRQPGFVYDVNSLYPSMMESESGSFYPVGEGTYYGGDFTDQEIKDLDKGKKYGFLHVQCEFHIKEKHLPCIQIKSDILYDSTEWLSTSDVYLKKIDHWEKNVVDLYLTYIDWKLIQKHYNLTNVKVISHLTYNTMTGIFDVYINKWAKIKQTSKGAKRQFAKLMLNNLYGKFSTSPDSSYMVCSYDTEKDRVVRNPVLLYDEKRAVYIPVGSAITSWARNFTISHAQDNFDIFCYADTDSIHCIGNKTEAVGIKEHPTAFCAWKNETNWDAAIFAGQKRYIEKVVEEDGEPVDWYYNIKCCGMGQAPKETLDKWLRNGDVELSDFKKGLRVPGNLKGHIVNGGTYLKEQWFEFH